MITTSEGASMSNRAQCIVGAIVGVSIGLAAYILAYVPGGASELGFAGGTAALATIWWRKGHRS